jgi:hypothetical protein
MVTGEIIFLESLENRNSAKKGGQLFSNVNDGRLISLISTVLVSAPFSQEKPVFNIATSKP